MRVSAFKAVSGGGHDMSCEVGQVHITGGFIAGMETLCGNVDTGLKYKETNEPVTCRACKEIYESIKKSRKRITFK